MSSSPIWFKASPLQTFDRASAHKFVPVRTMDLTQQLNALFRLGVYYSLVMLLLTQNAAHLTVALAMAAVTALVHVVSEKTELFQAAAGCAPCVPPTKNNPFMNALVMDRTDRGPACNPLNADVMAKIARDEKTPPADGPYEHGRTNRTWYTMPNTTAASRQGEFAEWLYGGDKGARRPAA